MEWVVEVHTHNSIVELNCMPARLKVEVLKTTRSQENY